MLQALSAEPANKEIASRSHSQVVHSGVISNLPEPTPTLFTFTCNVTICVCFLIILIRIAGQDLSGPNRAFQCVLRLRFESLRVRSVRFAFRIAAFAGLRFKPRFVRCLAHGTVFRRPGAHSRAPVGSLPLRFAFRIAVLLRFGCVSATVTQNPAAFHDCGSNRCVSRFAFRGHLAPHCTAQVLVIRRGPKTHQR